MVQLSPDNSNLFPNSPAGNFLTNFFDKPFSLEGLSYQDLTLLPTLSVFIWLCLHRCLYSVVLCGYWNRKCPFLVN